ncbi:DUF6332 family protein [Streptomyces beijiangensis]|uniref:Uncharacterized protein n=1 Tax=Streptomyces beijiangensis TaxID=163361 RepID=A0A939FE58_9ACTN|nr:DUF6332 family protein [Streptomyces beijiangensis]MBO0516988.1 hypothetical protein [Streptomyces beijiangensis]
MGHRSRAERDAMTVEIGYALVSAAFVAVATFAGVISPVYFFDLDGTARRALTVAAVVAAALVFVVRVVYVLWSYRGRPARQPIQPGRTRPDS